MTTLKQKEQIKQWRKNNPEKVKEQRKKWAEKNKEKKKLYNANYHKKNYEKIKEFARKREKLNPGIRKNINWKRSKMVNSDGSIFNLENYKILFEIQQGRCAICKKHRSELNQDFVVDHSHNTNLVRGLLCHRCNICLGYVEQTELCKKAKEFLTSFQPTD